MKLPPYGYLIVFSEQCDGLSLTTSTACSANTVNILHTTLQFNNSLHFQPVGNHNSILYSVLRNPTHGLTNRLRSTPRFHRYGTAWLLCFGLVEVNPNEWHPHSHDRRPAHWTVVSHVLCFVRRSAWEVGSPTHQSLLVCQLREWYSAQQLTCLLPFHSTPTSAQHSRWSCYGCPPPHESGPARPYGPSLQHPMNEPSKVTQQEGEWHWKVTVEDEGYYRLRGWYQSKLVHS